MTYEITIKIRYKNDLFHDEQLPDGAALVEQMKQDFDAVLGQERFSDLEIELVNEEEVKA